ncbi:LysR substrate-binding domain-containing protein [Phaeovulum sp. W22_SRMD_FR3]|uniref:LysR substrate-binding domain-containing protein n=1 Tax=Phaeovulum sp. W22_SRMD_FR3 TaxID=3240274 RepID=UPI003F9D5012
MNEIWIADFLTLAETRNFSRAAAQRNVTQPAFGRRIRAFEAWCGHALVDRTTHRLELTAAGVLVLAASEDLHRRIGRLRHALAALESHANTLTFAATQALSFTFFPGWIGPLSAGAAVHLLADNMQACERIMEAGAAQFLLCHTHPAMPLDLPGERYRTRSIGQDHLVPVAALRDGVPLHRLEAEAAPLLRFDEKSGLGRILGAALGPALSQFDLRPVFTSHVAMALKPMMLEGRGIAWLPLSLLHDDIAAGRCAVIGDAAVQIGLSVSLLRPRHRMAPLAEAFWSRIREAS